MIPKELRERPQWCCAASVEDKAPRMPDGTLASVDNPATWSTYQECLESDLPLVGYVFHKNDPLTGIDLDDHVHDPATEEQKERHRKIIKMAGSYTERSISGRGYHVIVKAKAPLNFIRDNVEVFDHGKYFIMTGDSLNGVDVKKRQKLVSTLCKEHQAKRATELISRPSNMSDERLIEMASGAKNGLQFDKLCNGDWEGDYPSQSEADLALFSMLCYYTPDNEQVIRIFHSTKLGQRDKAHKQKYLEYNLTRARSQEPPPIDLSALIDDNVKTNTRNRDKEQRNRRNERQRTGDRDIRENKETGGSNGRKKNQVDKDRINTGGKDNERTGQRDGEKNSKRTARTGSRDRREDSGKKKFRNKGFRKTDSDASSYGGHDLESGNVSMEERLGRTGQPDNKRNKNVRNRTGSERLGKKKPSTEPGLLGGRSGRTITQPGLLGDIGNYITESAIKPVPEVGLVASRGFLAALCGACINISGTGLNTYQILVAKTGIGKEGIASGIDRLINACAETIPAIVDRIGPSRFASGQAILKYLPEHNCFLSIVGEFGIELGIMSDPRAHAAEKTKLSTMLDLYNKSGWGQWLRPSVYSDSDKNTEAVHAPAVSIIGEGTPESLFTDLDDSKISSGLIPRFSIIQYKGKRPATNENAFFAPPKSLQKDIVKLTERCMQLEQQQKCIQVSISPSAADVLKDFDRYCDKLINDAHDSKTAQLWNRAYLKALKLAAIGAVGLSVSARMATIDVTGPIAQWAIDDVVNETEALEAVLSTGVYNQGSAQQEADVLRMLKEYVDLSPDKRRSYGVVKKMVYENGYVPFEYLRRKTRNTQAFKNDRRGPTQALKDLMKDLVDAGVVKQLAHRQVYEQFGINSPVYLAPKKRKKK